MFTPRTTAFLLQNTVDLRFRRHVSSFVRGRCQPHCSPAVTVKKKRPNAIVATNKTATKVPATVAAVLLSVCFLVSQPPSLSHAATVEDMQNVSSQASTTDTTVGSDTENEQELREKTQRNTRLSGRLSQQFSTARRLAENGDIDGALDAYNSLIKDAPNFAPAYSNRANLLVAKNRAKDALADYDRALELAPADGDVWVVLVNRGVTRLSLDGSTANAEAALADLNAAFNRKGGDPLILQNRAAAYEALGKWESAIRDYQGALKNNDVKPFWLRYALVLFQKGKSAESIAVLKRVSNSFNVDDVKAALAVVYFENGNLATAETLWSDMERPRLFESRQFLLTRKWPPRAVDGMDHFRTLKE